jgi:hypothetical protein
VLLRRRLDNHYRLQVPRLLYRLGSNNNKSEQGEQQQHEEEQDAQFTLAESSSRRRPKWVERTLREAQEQVDAPRTSVRRAGRHRGFPVTWLL